MGDGGSLIEGRVHRTDGSPVAEARVFIASGPVPSPDVAQLTDEDGRFILHAPAAGSYQIGCHAEGLAPVRVQAEVRREIQRTEVDIAMADE